MSASGGKPTDLDTLPGGNASHVTSINDHNQIVGSATLKGGQERAILWTLRSG